MFVFLLFASSAFAKDVEFCNQEVDSALVIPRCINNSNVTTIRSLVGYLAEKYDELNLNVEWGILLEKLKSSMSQEDYLYQKGRLLLLEDISSVDAISILIESERLGSQDAGLELYLTVNSGLDKNSKNAFLKRSAERGNHDAAAFYGNYLSTIKNSNDKIKYQFLYYLQYAALSGDSEAVQSIYELHLSKLPRNEQDFWSIIYKMYLFDKPDSLLDKVNSVSDWDYFCKRLSEFKPKHYIKVDLHDESIDESLKIIVTKCLGSP
jgi:hypothetical protein